MPAASNSLLTSVAGRIEHQLHALDAGRVELFADQCVSLRVASPQVGRPFYSPLDVAHHSSTHSFNLPRHLLKNSVAHVPLDDNVSRHRRFHARIEKGSLVF